MLLLLPKRRHRRSQFLTRLETTPVGVRDGCKKMLLADFSYYSRYVDAVITVPTNYKTDLNSTPRWPVIFWLVGATSDEAAVIHDYLYTTKRFHRKIADAILEEASAVTGVPAWRRLLMYYGVRLFGWRHW